MTQPPTNLSASSIFFRILVVLALLIPSFSCLGQAPKPRALPATPPSVAVSALEPPEISILKAQLDDARKHQDQMLTTVWGALGTIATVTALLVGFGWFANVRMYDRDKASLEQGLRALLHDEQRRMREELHAELRASSEVLHKDLSIGMAKTNEEMESALAASQRQTVSKISTQVSSVLSELSSVRHMVFDLEYQAKLQEREKYLQSGNLRNALQMSTDALSIAKKTEYDNNIGNTLDLVATDIEAILSHATRRIDNFLLAQVIEVLGSVKGKHEVVSIALRSKAANIKTGN